MTLDEFLVKTRALGIDSADYSLDGSYGNGYEVWVLSEKNNGWEVFFVERGQKDNSRVSFFESKELALNYMCWVLKIGRAPQTVAEYGDGEKFREKSNKKWWRFF